MQNVWLGLLDAAWRMSLWCTAPRWSRNHNHLWPFLSPNMTLRLRSLITPELLLNLRQLQLWDYRAAETVVLGIRARRDEDSQWFHASFKSPCKYESFTIRIGASLDLVSVTTSYCPSRQVSVFGIQNFNVLPWHKLDLIWQLELVLLDPSRFLCHTCYHFLCLDKRLLLKIGYLQLRFLLFLYLVWRSADLLLNTSPDCQKQPKWWNYGQGQHIHFVRMQERKI